MIWIELNWIEITASFVKQLLYLLGNVQLLSEDRDGWVGGHVEEGHTPLGTLWDGVVDGVGCKGLQVHQQVVCFLQTTVGENKKRNR